MGEMGGNNGRELADSSPLYTLVVSRQRSKDEEG